MKNHHNCNIISLGASDIASLTYRSGSKVGTINFGSDGHYQAYLADEETTIPPYYDLTVEAKNWMRIFDDFGLVASLMADSIRIYQAGNFGCIIQLIGDAQVIDI